MPKLPTQPIKIAPRPEPRWRRVGNGVFELCDPIDFGSFVVPAGYRTDGASTPWVVWPIFPPFGYPYTIAATGHDYACEHARQLNLTRPEVDALFFRWMLEQGCPQWQAALFFIAVRIGNLIGWERARRIEDGQ